MKKFFRYADSRGRVILVTSHQTGQNYMNRTLNEPETAIFSGEEMRSKKTLIRIERGIYRVAR